MCFFRNVHLTKVKSGRMAMILSVRRLIIAFWITLASLLPHSSLFLRFGLEAGKAKTTAIVATTAVGGGTNNAAIENYSAVFGGFRNSATGNTATVSGGIDNVASGNFSSVSGGASNEAGPGAGASVSGGGENTAIGKYATVSGGWGRSTVRPGSWAAGGLMLSGS